MRKPGYVYVLTNRAFPKLLKIGRTTRTPEIRAQELSKQTGVPYPYEVYYNKWFADHKAAERYVHKAFAEKRVRGKEFFKVDPDEVVTVISKYPSRNLFGFNLNLRKRQRNKGLMKSRVLFVYRVLSVIVVLLMLGKGIENSLQVKKRKDAEKFADVDATSIVTEVERGQSIIIEEEFATEETEEVFFTGLDDFYEEFGLSDAEEPSNIEKTKENENMTLPTFGEQDVERAGDPGYGEVTTQELDECFDQLEKQECEVYANDESLEQGVDFTSGL